MAKINAIDKEIPNIDTSWQIDEKNAYSGKRVEEFIKKQLKQLSTEGAAKVGYLCRTPDKQDDQNYHLLGFASQETYNEWNEDQSNHPELVLCDIALPAGGGASTQTSYVVNLYTNSNQTAIVSTNGKFVLQLRYTSQIYNPITQTTEDSGNGGTLVIQRRADATQAWEKVGEMDIASLPASSTSWTDVDITKYVQAGSQQIRVLVKDSANSLSTRYLVFNSVVNTTLSLAYAGEWRKPITDGVIPLSYKVTGAVAKTLHVKVSGFQSDGKTVGYREYTEQLGSTVSETATNGKISDSDTDAIKINNNGIHTLEAWLTVDASGEETEHIYSQVLVIKDATATTPYVIVNNRNDNAQMYTETHFFDFAVYNPAADTTAVKLIAKNTDGSTTYKEKDYGNIGNGSAAAKNVQSYTDTLEIDSDDTVAVWFHFTLNGTETTTPVHIDVKANKNFKPTSNPDFVLAPNNRTNNEAAAEGIINAATGKTVDGCTFTGFGKTNDLWVDNVLRVPAGRKVHIGITEDGGKSKAPDAFSELADANNEASMTMEVVLKAYNIRDMETTILSMLKDDIGLKLQPTHGLFKTSTQVDELNQDWSWREGEKVFLAINIIHNLRGEGLNYIRIFINGTQNREFNYADNDGFVASGATAGPGITIGSDDADVDIYSIKIFKRALGQSDIRQDYLSMLDTTAEKQEYLDKNAIVGDDGTISYEKTKVKYNTILVEGARMPDLQYPDKVKSGMTITFIKPGDKAHSGVASNMGMKGQGSSSKLKGHWNQQPVWNTDSKFVTEDGVDHGQEFLLNDDTYPFSKGVWKLNYASSPQAYKMGACNAYNDIYKQLVADGKMTADTIIADDNKRRLAVNEEPFMLFWKNTETGNIEFYGLVTWGSAKFDKKTFGFDKKVYPDLCVLEGSVNYAPLVMGLVPWMSDEVTTRMDSEDVDGFNYAGDANWDFDGGDPTKTSYAQTAWNWMYLHGIRLKAFDGTATELLAKADTLDKTYKYWVTKADSTITGSKIGDVYRYDYITKIFVPASTSKTDGKYDLWNIGDAYPTVSISTSGDTTVDTVTQNLIAALVSDFKANASKYFKIDALLFEQCFKKLFALSDNWCKNTYMLADPITHLICWRSDDNDTLRDKNNSGQHFKPYWVEEHDTVTVGSVTSNYFNSDYNQLFVLTEKAFDAEMRQMMHSVFTAMAELYQKHQKDDGVTNGLNGVNGFMDAYFYKTQRYFPSVAYNETARVIYEADQKRMKDGLINPDAIPMTESLGDQLKNDQQFDDYRLEYLSGYAQYGNYEPTKMKGLSFRSTTGTNGVDCDIEITPAVWMYPAIQLDQGASYGEGNSLPQRAKAGEKFVLKNVHFDNNKSNVIGGGDCIAEYGDFAVVPVGETFTLTGKRLQSFKVSKGGTFVPTTMEVAAPMLKDVVINGVNTFASLDLSEDNALESVDVSRSGVTVLTLPETPTLKTVKEATPTEIKVGRCANAVLSAEDYSKITTVSIAKEAKSIDTLGLVNNLYTAKAKVTNLSMGGMDWSNVAMATMNYLMGITTCTLTGKIAIKGSVGLSDIQKIENKWGDVTNVANALYVTYTVVNITNVYLDGKKYLDTVGKEYQLVATSYPENGNDLKSEQWNISANSFATIDSKSGKITVNTLGSEANDDTATVTYTVTTTEGKQLSATFDVKLYAHTLKIGDYVYPDGSYSDYKEPNRAIIGICFNTSPRRMVALSSFGGLRWGIQSTLNVKLSDGTNPGDISTLVNTGASTLDQTDALIENFGPYEKDEQIPLGAADTAKIIAWRNKVLKDSAINMPVPEETPTITLESLIGSADVKVNNGGAYYYPAASYCWRYQPDAGKEALLDKFKATHWWLPTVAELNALEKLQTAGNFAEPIKRAVMRAISGDWHWSCQEDNGYNAYFVNSGGTTYGYKNYSFIVRAVAAF